MKNRDAVVLEDNRQSPIRSHLNMLVQLARADGVVVQEEIDLIKKIGKEYGVSADEISNAFDDPSNIEIGAPISDDLKYDFMYNIVQLMKIDGRVYQEEIRYCAGIASKLGYEEEVLREMMVRIYSDPHISTDKATLKSKIQSYLKDK